MGDFEPTDVDIENLNLLDDLIKKGIDSGSIEFKQISEEYELARKTGGKYNITFNADDGSLDFERNGQETGRVNDYIEKLKNIKENVENKTPEEVSKSVRELATEKAKAMRFDGNETVISSQIAGIERTIVNPEMDAKGRNPEANVPRAKEIMGNKSIPTVADVTQRTPINTQEVNEATEKPVIKNLIAAIDPKDAMYSAMKGITESDMSPEDKKAAFNKVIDGWTESLKKDAQTVDQKTTLEWLGDKMKEGMKELWDKIDLSSLAKLGALIFVLVFSVNFINEFCVEKSGCFVDIIDPKTNSVIKTYKISGLSCGKYRKSNGKYYDDYGDRYKKECIISPNPTLENPSGCGPSCTERLAADTSDCPCPFHTDGQDDYASTFCDDSFLQGPKNDTNTHKYYKRYYSFTDGVAAMINYMADIINTIVSSDGPIGNFIQTILNLIKYGAIVAVVFVFIYAIFYAAERFNFIGGKKSDGSPVVVQIDERGRPLPTSQPIPPDSVPAPTQPAPSSVIVPPPVIQVSADDDEAILNAALSGDVNILAQAAHVSDPRQRLESRRKNIPVQAQPASVQAQPAPVQAQPDPVQSSSVSSQTIQNVTTVPEKKSTKPQQITSANLQKLLRNEPDESGIFSKDIALPKKSPAYVAEEKQEVQVQSIYPSYPSPGGLDARELAQKLEMEKTKASSSSSSSSSSSGAQGAEDTFSSASTPFQDIRRVSGAATPEYHNLGEGVGFEFGFRKSLKMRRRRK